MSDHGGGGAGSVLAPNVWQNDNLLFESNERQIVLFN